MLNLTGEVSSTSSGLCRKSRVGVVQPSPRKKGALPPRFVDASAIIFASSRVLVAPFSVLSDEITFPGVRRHFVVILGFCNFYNVEPRTQCLERALG
jgi:hypothetical protein